MIPCLFHTEPLVPRTASGSQQHITPRHVTRTRPRGTKSPFRLNIFHSLKGFFIGLRIAGGCESKRSLRYLFQSEGAQKVPPDACLSLFQAIWAWEQVTPLSTSSDLQPISRGLLISAAIWRWSSLVHYSVFFSRDLKRNFANNIRHSCGGEVSLILLPRAHRETLIQSDALSESFDPPHLVIRLYQVSGAQDRISPGRVLPAFLRGESQILDRSYTMGSTLEGT